MKVKAPPCDERGFLHKRIIGAIGGLIKGGPVSGIAGFLTGGGGAGDEKLRNFCATATPPLTPADAARCASKGFPTRGMTGMVAQGCPPGYVRGPAGHCIEERSAGDPRKGWGPRFQRLLPGGQTGRFEFGEAEVGRFGAGLVPGVRDSEIRFCPRGAVLAVDGLCYNRRDLRNSDRAWPRGRRPLLTGGQMRAISIASTAANKLQRTQKRLEDLGMLKKPARRSRPALPSGHHAHAHHN